MSTDDTRPDGGTDPRRDDETAVLAPVEDTTDNTTDDAPEVPDEPTVVLPETAEDPTVVLPEAAEDPTVVFPQATGDLPEAADGATRPLPVQADDLDAAPSEHPTAVLAELPVDEPAAPATPAPDPVVAAAAATPTPPPPAGTRATAPVADVPVAPTRRPRLRVSTVVWGLVIATIGVGILAWASGFSIDLQLSVIVLLAAAGTALLVGSIVSGARSSRR